MYNKTQVVDFVERASIYSSPNYIEQVRITSYNNSEHCFYGTGVQTKDIYGISYDTVDLNTDSFYAINQVNQELTMLLSKTKQDQVIRDLAKLYGIRDVYWHKDRLFVVNSYDIPDIEEYLDTNELGQYIIYQYVEEDFA